MQLIWKWRCGETCRSPLDADLVQASKNAGVTVLEA